MRLCRWCALDRQRSAQISVGGELAVVAGPVGNGLALDSGIEAAPVFSYTKSKGLYGGIQLNGNVIIERGDENEVYVVGFCCARMN